jgi:hypothetical protein
MSKIIALTQGKETIVDDDDYEWLSKYKWHYNIGYAFRKNNGKKIRMHREICRPPNDMQIDHINHNKLDNRKCNLRICTDQQNRRNCPPSSANTSGYIGIQKNGKRWQARTEIHDKLCFIGSFDTQEEAAHAYDKKVKELFGEFAYTNF